jgi:CubicO group peptidase (beta-lactamase class C family)
MTRLKPALFAALAFFALAPQAIAADRPAAPATAQPTPESVGLSRARLNAMAAHFDAEAKAKAAPGYVLLIARHGKVIFSSTTGYRDIEAGAPMTMDTRFRIASMTKPITSAAVMMLVEDGRLHLHDPVSRYLPEFAEMRVATGVDEKGEITTEPAKRRITIEDLLTHTSGLGYVFDVKTPLGKVWRGLMGQTAADLAEFSRKIATMPLYFHPGERFFYSFADDILGRVVEVVSGQPFDQFLDTRLFAPLGMKSTGFRVAKADIASLATLYRHDANGGLERSTAISGDPTSPTVLPLGGGGLISTVPDYFKFAQMLANGGSFEGKRYLSPATVAQMIRNRLPAFEMEKFWGPNSKGLGYGLGLGMTVDAGRAPYAALDGDFSWGGLYDTQWVASPQTGIVAVIMTQMDPSGDREPKRTSTDFRNLLYAAVTDLDGRAKPAR